MNAGRNGDVIKKRIKVEGFCWKGGELGRVEEGLWEVATVGNKGNEDKDEDKKLFFIALSVVCVCQCLESSISLEYFPVFLRKSE